MPAIWSNSMNLHPDDHRWHARQSSPSASTSSSSAPTSSSASTSSSSASTSNLTIPLSVLAVVIVWILAWNIVKCKRRAQRLTRAARPVVRAPPGSRLAPIIAEILAATLSQAGAVAHAPESNSPPAYYGDVQDPARAANRPSQPPPLFTNSLHSANDDNYRSRTTLNAVVTQADEPPRTVVIHQDAGSAPDDEAAPVELPPPYSSIALA